MITSVLMCRCLLFTEALSSLCNGRVFGETAFEPEESHGRTGLGAGRSGPEVLHWPGGGIAQPTRSLIAIDLFQGPPDKATPGPKRFQA